MHVLQTGVLLHQAGVGGQIRQRQASALGGREVVALTVDHDADLARRAAALVRDEPETKTVTAHFSRAVSVYEGSDVVVVPDASAPPLWARFYEIGTNRPIFSGQRRAPPEVTLPPGGRTPHRGGLGARRLPS